MATYASVFLPEKSHGQRNLTDYSPCNCKRVRHHQAGKPPPPPPERMPLRPPLYVLPPLSRGPVQGRPWFCKTQETVLDRPQPLACRPARCQNQGPQNRHTCSSTQILGETGSVVVMKNRMCQNDGLGDYVLSASLLLTAILAVLSQPGVECGQPPVRSSIQRKMGGGQATTRRLPNIDPDPNSMPRFLVFSGIVAS